MSFFMRRIEKFTIFVKPDEEKISKKPDFYKKLPKMSKTFQADFSNKVPIVRKSFCLINVFKKTLNVLE